MRAAHDAFESLVAALADFDRVHGEFVRSMKTCTAGAGQGSVEMLQREDALHACVSAAQTLARRVYDMQPISRRLVNAARRDDAQVAPGALCMTSADLALASRTLVAESIAEARQAELAARSRAALLRHADAISARTCCNWNRRTILLERWRLHCEAMKHRAHGGSESEDESDSGASGDKVEGAASPAAIGVTPRPAAS